MSKQPLISVIIPVYNVKDYIHECIESIRDQTYQKLEVIIVDDGSNDGSEVICDEIGRENPSYIIIHKENGGLSDARNVGIERSTGDYISFLDSDDIISPVFYEIIVESIIKKNAGMAVIKQPTHYWDGEHVILAKNKSECSYCYKSGRDSLVDMLYLRIATGAPFKVADRKIIKQIRFPKGFYYEDIATTYKYFLMTDTVAIIDGNMYGYRKRKTSIIRQDFSLKKMTVVDAAHQIISGIDVLNDPRLNRAVQYRVFSPLFSVFLQIPRDDDENRKIIWNELLTLRKSVLFEKHSIRRKDRIAAAMTYAGMHISYYMGRKYGQRDTFFR